MLGSKAWQLVRARPLQNRNNVKDNPESGQSPSTLEVAFSVIAAALGVQNSKNRERDFTHGSPVAFIVAGLIFTFGLVGAIVAVVKLVLSQT